MPPRAPPMSRIAIETRNELVFELTGGSGQAPPTHRLIVRLSSTRNALIRDVGPAARSSRTSASTPITR